MNTDDFMHGQTYIGQFRDIRPDLEGAYVCVSTLLLRLEIGWWC